MYNEDDPRKAVDYSNSRDQNPVADDKRSLGERLGDAIIVIGVFVFIWGIGVLGYQCFLWLRHGFWTERYFQVALDAIGLGKLSSSWGGAEKIIEWIDYCPLSGGLIWSSFPIIGVGAWVRIRAEERELERIKEQKRQEQLDLRPRGRRTPS